MAFVVVAEVAGVAYFAAQPGFGDVARVAGAASDDLYAVCLEGVEGALPHVAGEHEGDAAFLEDGGDA